MNQDRLIKEFIELVQIDSETKHEAAIATVLKKKFKQLGLKVEEDDAARKTGHAANNLICTLQGSIPIEPIFFTAHMDTVTPGTNISPIQKNGYIKSNGNTILGADDKAGIAVILEVIRTLQEENIKHGDIQFIITVGEESGLQGAKAIDQHLIQATYGYALDSDGEVGSIVTEAPYQAKLTSTITGMAAHAGVAPEKGVSAITVAAKAIGKLKLGRIDHETTANIGFFKGGKRTQTNVVCDLVEIVAEARSVNKEKLTTLTSEMNDVFHNTAQQYGATADVQIQEMYPGFHHGEETQVVQMAKQAAEKLGLPSHQLKSGGGSDANIFNGYGIPTVNLAVGYEYIHTTKEQIHERHLITLTDFVLQIIKETTR